MKNVFEQMEERGARENMEHFRQLQKLPYAEKKLLAAGRVKEFVCECIRRGYNCHVSVGGLDSITLFMFINYSDECADVRRLLGHRVPGISASFLEDKSIIKVHKALGIECVKPLKDKEGRTYSKARIIQEFGFPVISKETALKIETLQHPTDKNKTIRHAIVTGETGEYGGYQTNSRMKLSQKWLEKFGGYENENEGFNYGMPDFQVSSKCCYYLKEKPCDDWAKAHHSVPFLGLMASEHGRREKSLMMNGCNYWGKSTIRSCPFATFSRQDILTLADEMNDIYVNDIRTDGMPETIIPTIYGTLNQDLTGDYYTTGAQRTGCSLCGFGIHFEKRPHRFDQLRERNPKEWHYLMYEMCTDSDGNKFGWGKVLDYIGVEWR